MLTFAYYLLKVSFCSGVLFGYYFFLLRNNRFHQYNRFYLIFAVVMSWLIPVAKIKFWSGTAQQEMPAIKLLKVVATRDAFAEASLKSASLFSDVNTLAFVIFLIISAVFLFWLLISIARIIILIRANTDKSRNNIYFICTEAKGTPFSFFKYIFWNKNIDLQTQEGKLILQHELVHVNEKHSADKLFLQIIIIIGWINPFFWLIRKELNMIHEFIADEKAISDGDTDSFSAMLLKSAYPQHSFTLANSFFHSPIKRRLIMFTNSKKPSYSYFRRLMILPLLSFVIVFFSFKFKGESSYKMKSNSAHLSAFGFKNIVVKDEADKTNLISVKGDTTIKIATEKAVETITNGQTNTKNNTANTPALNKIVVILDGVKMSWEDYTKKKVPERQIKEISVWNGKQAIERYGEKGAGGVLEINTKGEVDKKIETSAEITASDTIEAKFPGGNLEWKKYLETNLNANVAVEKDKAPAGVYTVKLQFIVTETGEIKDVSAIKSPARCPSCAIEAVRIIKSGPKWEPMTINGKNAVSQAVQFISIVVEK